MTAGQSRNSPRNNAVSPSLRPQIAKIRTNLASIKRDDEELLQIEQSKLFEKNQ
jgi:hypothetical protein